MAETVALGDLEVVRYTAGNIPEPDVMESIDYRDIQALTVAIYDRAITLPQ